MEMDSNSYEDTIRKKEDLAHSLLDIDIHLDERSRGIVIRFSPKRTVEFVDPWMGNKLTLSEEWVGYVTSYSSSILRTHFLYVQPVKGSSKQEQDRFETAKSYYERYKTGAPNTWKNGKPCNCAWHRQCIAEVSDDLCGETPTILALNAFNRYCTLTAQEASAYPTYFLKALGIKPELGHSKPRMDPDVAEKQHYSEDDEEDDYYYDDPYYNGPYDEDPLY